MFTIFMAFSLFASAFGVGLLAATPGFPTPLLYLVSLMWFAVFLCAASPRR